MRQYCLQLQVILLLAINSLNVSAKSYYVSPLGKDSNPGTLALPFKTLQRAADALNGGDTLFVREGTYQEQVYFETTSSPGVRTVITNYPGENPVIDGNYTIPSGNLQFTDPVSGKTQDAFALVMLWGNNLLFKGIEIKRSGGVGITIANYGDNDISRNNIIDSCNIHDTRGGGVLLYKAINCTVRNTTIKRAADFAPYWNNREVDWPVALISNNSTGATFYQCTVSESWSEGIGMWNSSEGTIEACTVYDNMSGQIYLDNALNSVVNGNLIYHTGHPEFKALDGGVPDGINVADEPSFPSQGEGVTITNNCIRGVQSGIRWRNFQSESGLKDAIIAHNSIINPASGELIHIEEGNHRNILIANNILGQDNANLSMIRIQNMDPSAFTIKSNLWSKDPGEEFRSPNDITADPEISRTGSVSSGELTRSWFETSAGAPGINQGVVIPEVTADMYAQVRGTSPDLGAYEFSDEPDAGGGAAGTGLFYALYNNKTLSGSPTATGVDATVNFNWKSGGKTLLVDNFSLRWTGQVKAQHDEEYTFFTRADDGTRLWVNGQLLVNDWTNHAAREKSGKITLQAGQKYDIKLEYFENKGGAVCQLRWKSASQSKQIIPSSFLYPAAAPVTATADYMIRARGLQGTEEMALLIGGEPVKSWTVTTAMKNYSYTGSQTGSVRVAFTNDQGANHDLRIDKLTVNSTPYQSESQVVNTAVWQGQCGGTYSEWLHCGGYVEFDLKSPNARQAGQLPKELATATEPVGIMAIYPNPSVEGRFLISGVDAARSQVYLYTLLGQHVPVRQQVADAQRLAVRVEDHVPTGIYLLRVHTPGGAILQRKLVIK